MAKKLLVRCNDQATYEVHIEVGDPPKKFVGGQFLNLEPLKTELLQHGCSQEMIVKVLQDLESGGSATILL